MTGELSFLPVHAAGKYDESGRQVCASDFMVSSYVPTLSSLTKARTEWHSISCGGIQGLLVCEAAGHTGFKLLRKVREEIDIARACFEKASASVATSSSRHTSLAEMREMLEKNPHILHLACHGVQDRDPLKSAFILQDGRLSIEDIMKLDLPRAVMAYLSACETAKGHLDQPDQAVHLAASMLYCGFRSVIATMW
jgi:CHAT domain-containing protein